MSEIARKEQFSIAFDHRGSVARIAMAGAGGTNILIKFNFEQMPEAPNLENAILKEGENCLRNALVQLIANGWPKQE